jgi:hypothetical protein
MCTIRWICKDIFVDFPGAGSSAAGSAAPFPEKSRKLRGSFRIQDSCKTGEYLLHHGSESCKIIQTAAAAAEKRAEEHRAGMEAF